jgi:hypothetical protein
VCYVKIAILSFYDVNKTSADSFYFFFQILYIFYLTIFIPAVIQGWARPRWVVTPAPGLHGREGWLGENQTQDWNQQSPGENRTRDWTSTFQRANHSATLHPQALSYAASPVWPAIKKSLCVRFCCTPKHWATLHPLFDQRLRKVSVLGYWERLSWASTVVSTSEEA